MLLLAQLKELKAVCSSLLIYLFFTKKRILMVKIVVANVEIIILQIKYRGALKLCESTKNK